MLVVMMLIMKEGMGEAGIMSLPEALRMLTLLITM